MWGINNKVYMHAISNPKMLLLGTRFAGFVTLWLFLGFTGILEAFWKHNLNPINFIGLLFLSIVAGVTFGMLAVLHDKVSGILALISFGVWFLLIWQFPSMLIGLFFWFVIFLLVLTSGGFDNAIKNQG